MRFIDLHKVCVFYLIETTYVDFTNFSLKTKINITSGNSIYVIEGGLHFLFLSLEELKIFVLTNILTAKKYCDM